jgi:adenylate cyclase
MGGALLLLVIYSSLTLRTLVVAPLRTVVEAMRAVHEGSLETELNFNRTDEIGVLAQTYNYMVRGLRDRDKLKDAFNRYVSESVYKKFQAGEITLTGENRNATILFSDIRSFTTLSEQLTPAEVVSMLNEYFSEMVDIVFRYDGFVNKFIGDALMAIYNVPVEQSQPELRAVRTAVEMVESLDRLNAKRQARGDFAIKIGIGVNTGPVIAGNIGHEKRLEYTVIGDSVNLAQRIESQTKVAGASVLVSESTYAVVREHVIAEELPPVKVKGKAEPVKLFAVTAMTPTAPVPDRKV